jgi:GTPase SAR1 family protein
MLCVWPSFFYPRRQFLHESSVLGRFTRDEFDRYTKATIGADFITKVITVDGKQVKPQIWDTCGFNLVAIVSICQLTLFTKLVVNGTRPSFPCKLRCHFMQRHINNCLSLGIVVEQLVRSSSMTSRRGILLRTPVSG